MLFFQQIFVLEKPYCTVYDFVHAYMHLCVLDGINKSWLFKKNVIFMLGRSWSAGDRFV